jgi:hypothetical protein
MVVDRGSEAADAPVGSVGRRRRAAIQVESRQSWSGAAVRRPRAWQATSRLVTEAAAGPGAAAWGRRGFRAAGKVSSAARAARAWWRGWQGATTESEEAMAASVRATVVWRATAGAREVWERVGRRAAGREAPEAEPAAAMRRNRGGMGIGVEGDSDADTEAYSSMLVVMSLADAGRRGRGSENTCWAGSCSSAARAGTE